MGRLAEIIRRFPYCTGCLVATIGLGVAAWFLNGQLAQLKLQHEERSREGEAMLATLIGGSVLRQELINVREYVRRIEENLLIETNLAENTWYFFKLEEQTRVKLPELHQLSSPPSDQQPLFRRIPYTLRVTGTHDQVAAFLLALETGPRLVKIVSFSFSRRDASGNNLALDLSIELLGRK